MLQIKVRIRYLLILALLLLLTGCGPASTGVFEKDPLKLEKNALSTIKETRDLAEEIAFAETLEEAQELGEDLEWQLRDAIDDLEDAIRIRESEAEEAERAQGEGKFQLSRFKEKLQEFHANFLPEEPWGWARMQIGSFQDEPEGSASVAAEYHPEDGEEEEILICALIIFPEEEEAAAYFDQRAAQRKVLIRFSRFGHPDVNEGFLMVWREKRVGAELVYRWDNLVSIFQLSGAPYDLTPLALDQQLKIYHAYEEWMEGG